jgi:hypothetical protein
MNDRVISFAEQVWDTLSKTDVSPHVKQLEKTSGRPAIDYLPWHKAWLLLKREFPASTFYYDDDLTHEGGTVEVGVQLTVQKDNGGLFVSSMCRLPVMNFKFSAITDPNARERNDARQRCLVKACAFAGLGLDLWSESPVPVGRFNDPISAKQLKTLQDLIKKTGTDPEFFAEWCECELEELPIERYPSAFGLLSAKLKKVNKK